MRVAQPVGTRGSLKWIQRAVAQRPDLLQPPSLPSITWLSPLAPDDFAEYRDGAFLELLGLVDLRPAMRDFWPLRGPQWDALGRAGELRILLEAKAHIGEFLTPASKASEASKSTILSSLHAVRTELSVEGGVDWSRTFYQFTNRLAHLWWLRSRGVNAHLIFASFLHDVDMGGPRTPETWQAAFTVAEHALGLPTRHALTPYVHHVWPDIRHLDA